MFWISTPLLIECENENGDFAGRVDDLFVGASQTPQQGSGLASGQAL